MVTKEVPCDPFKKNDARGTRASKLLSEYGTHHVRTIRDVARYFNRPPDQLGPDQLREYQAYLFRERKLAANTVNQRTAALRFFFVATLKKPWTIAETPYPRKTFRLPKILSVEQVSKLIAAAPTLFYRFLLIAL